jgi:putative tricarboxylic transport membrane protein
MKNSADIVAGIVLIFVGIGAIVGAVGLRVGTLTEPQPGFFPFVSGVSILILSSIILVQGWLGRTKSRISFGEIRRPAMLIAVLIAFVGLLEPLGYIIASPIMVVLALRIMGIRSWKVLLTTSLGLSIGTFILFDRLLGITLPVGILSRLGL